MIEITRSSLQMGDWNVKVVGVGGAGCHAVDRLHQDGFSGGELIVANTDARALGSCSTSLRMPLGQRLTRGLGAGGDPELGRAAVEESLAGVTEQLAGAALVVVLTGLGGGTSSGGAPRIAQIARELGAHVVAIATMPFSFEGKRRAEQAAEGLAALREYADLVICFENDRMSSLVDSSAGVEETFGTVDSLIAQSVRALISMTEQRGVMHSGLDEIAAAVSGIHAGALFGFGTGHGENRAMDALHLALESPLLGGVEALQEATGLWAYVAGGSDLRWAEVQAIMTELNRMLSERVRLFFGAAVDPQLNGSVSLTLLAGVQSLNQVQEQPETQVVTSSRRAVGAQQIAFVEQNLLPSQERHEVPTGHEQEPSRSVSIQIEPAVTELLTSEEASKTQELQRSEEPELHVEQSSADSVSVEETLIPEPIQPSVQSRSVVSPPFEKTPEARRDIGASFLKRRLLARNAAATARAEEMASLEAAREEALEADPVPAEEPVETRADIASAVLEEKEEPSVNVPGTGLGTRSKPSVQEQMHFETVNRGRFEKTDPTMVDGQDLDVPTFLRRRVNLSGDAAPSGH